MVSLTAEQRVTFPMLTAQWLRQAFVHWPYRPDEVQPLLPKGLIVDEYDGRAWVSVTPFVMACPRPLAGPVMAGLAAFPETNLRTYVRAPDGRDGLWFLSIEVGSAVMLAARGVGAPYHLGDLSVSAYADVVSYAGSRRGGGPSYRMDVRPGAPIQPSARDVWLTSRWRAYTHRLGRTWQTPVEHEPWPLSEGTLVGLRENLTSAAGLPTPSGVPIVHYSEGVGNARLGLPRPIPHRERSTRAPRRRVLRPSR